MSQTLAVFYDAYRALNSRKMFWVVLLLSVLVAGAFACVGINERGLKILFWQFDLDMFNSEMISPAAFYKMMFTVGIDWWLALAASILALISTASMFPDLINSGSIHLLISKPISRLRLFGLQYLAGLLFVTLQVALFTGACFLVIGLRGGVWEPSLFLAVPIVVCFFSYLFSVCVLLGIVTRSTLASLLLTLLFWLVVFGVGLTENVLLAFNTAHQHGGFGPPVPEARAGRGFGPDRRVVPEAAPEPPPTIRAITEPPADDDSTPLKRSTKVPRALGRSLLKVLTDPAEETAMAGAVDSASPWANGLPPAAAPLDDAPLDDWGFGDGSAHTATDSTAQAELPETEGSRNLRLAHGIAYAFKTVLPKTTETIGLLERYLIDLADLPQTGAGSSPQRGQVGMEVAETVRSRSVWWVVGTSLGFEALVLAGAALLFCRRDY